MLFSLESYPDLLSGYISAFLTRIPDAMLTLILGYLALRLLQWLMGVGLRASRVGRAMQQILLSSVSVILWVGLAALVLQSLGLSQIAIALSSVLAIVGVGIASGAQKVVADVLAGLSLAKNRDFKIGQYIHLDDIEGQIHSLDSRKVRLLGPKNQLYIIPNSKFDEQAWMILPDKPVSSKKETTDVES